MRDVAALCVRRNDQAWNADSKPAKVRLRRTCVVVPATPIVPHHEDGRAVPVLAFADRVDDRGHPRRAAIASKARMIGIDLALHYTAESDELAQSRICQDLRLRSRDVSLPVRPLSYVGDRFERFPKSGVD